MTAADPEPLGVRQPAGSVTAPLRPASDNTMVCLAAVAWRRHAGAVLLPAGVRP